MRLSTGERYAVVLARRREDHKSELGRLVRLRDWARGNLERAEQARDEVAAVYAVDASDRVSGWLERAEDLVEQRREELAAAGGALDEGLERFSAGDHPPDPAPLEASLAEAVAESDDEIASAYEFDGRSGARLRRRAARLREQAVGIRAAVKLGGPTPGLSVARRSPSSSGRPRGRRAVARSSSSAGDDPGGSTDAGDPGRPPSAGDPR